MGKKKDYSETLRYAEEQFLKMKNKYKAKKFDVQNYEYVLERQKFETVLTISFLMCC